MSGNDRAAGYERRAGAVSSFPNRAPISSTLRCTASRTEAGRASKGTREEGDNFLCVAVSIAMRVVMQSAAMAWHRLPACGEGGRPACPTAKMAVPRPESAPHSLHPVECLLQNVEVAGSAEFGAR